MWSNASFHPSVNKKVKGTKIWQEGYCRLVDEFTAEPTDSEQQLIDCYFELPTCSKCSFRSSCNPRKAWTSELWKPNRLPPVCLYFKIRIAFRVLCSAKDAKSLKVCRKNARDVEFTNIEPLCLWVLKYKLFSNSPCQSTKSFRFNCADSQSGASGATCTEGKCNMAGLWTSLGMLG